MNDQYSLEDSDDHIRLRTAWNHVTKRVSTDLSSQAFERFIRPLKPVSASEESATISAPGKFVQEWVNARCLPMLEAYLSDEIGRPMRIELVWEAREKTVPKAQEVMVAAPIVETSAFRPNER